MDFSHLIQTKLKNADKCLCSLPCNVVENQSTSAGVISLIEHQEDHGLFVYKVPDTLADTPKDLSLEWKLPVDTSLAFNIVSSQATATQGYIMVHLTSSQLLLMLEVPHGDKLDHFQAELRRTKQIYSQNVGFGLPSTFDWMEKYVTSSSAGNPFEINIFDPFANHISSQKDWPLNQIIEPVSAHQCPVVKDTTTSSSSRSPSASPSLRRAVKKRTMQLTSSLTSSLTGHVVDGLSDLNQRRWNSVRDQATPSPLSMETPAAPTGGREAIAGLLMRERQLDYTQLKYFRLFCGTWNVNGQAATCDIQAWLSPPSDNVAPDIYAIGFQELDLSTNAYIFSGSVREEEWYSKVVDALHEKANYRKLKLVRLVGIMLVIFVRDVLYDSVQECSAQTVGTGLLGMMGNKGGVAVRLRLLDTTICFICSHLAAHTEDVEGRNQDFREISSKLLFDSYHSISDHDVVFWLGDLNYRISDIEPEDCKQMITKGELEHLLRNNDQLVRQRALRCVFLDYVEGDVTFNPTYKYDPGTDNWDSSEKCRTPAWCDRILWRGENIEQLVYRSHPGLRLSDHKPVSAVFQLGVKEINAVLERKVREEVIKVLDQRENEYLPQVILDTIEVHFENVKFIEPQRWTITLTNTGQVPVQFEFINKLNDSYYCKPWLSVEPSRGFIHINDKASVELELYVNKSTAVELNSGRDNLDDILVLHLQGGKDLFITVSGSYLRSCFGSSIEDLVRMYGHIREVETASLIDLHSKSSSSSGQSLQPLDVPKELWRLVDYIFMNGLNEEELFRLPGLHNEVALIRDSLDTGTPTKLPGSIHSVVEALLMLIDSFAEPVIPCQFYSRCIEACTNETLCKQVLSSIPVSHRNVFKYVCAFLRKLLQHSATNKLDTKTLATMFGSLLLRAPPSESTTQQSEQASSTSRAREESRKKANFVWHFLVNEYDD